MAKQINFHLFLPALSSKLALVSFLVKKLSGGCIEFWSIKAPAGGMSLPVVLIFLGKICAKLVSCRENL